MLDACGMRMTYKIIHSLTRPPSTTCCVVDIVLRRPIELVMPYLIRRAHENSAMTKGPGIGRELAMLRTELWRRLRHFGSSSSGSRGAKVHASA
jgi:hypothetical protein